MVEYSKWYTKRFHTIKPEKAGMVRFPGADRHTGSRTEEAH